MNDNSVSELFLLAFSTIIFLGGLLFMNHQKDSLYEMQNTANVEIIQKQEIQEKYLEDIDIDSPVAMEITGATVLQEILDNHKEYTFYIDSILIDNSKVAKEGAPYVKRYVSTNSNYKKTYQISNVTNIDDKTKGEVNTIIYRLTR